MLIFYVYVIITVIVALGLIGTLVVVKIRGRDMVKIYFYATVYGFMNFL